MWQWDIMHNTRTLKHDMACQLNGVHNLNLFFLELLLFFDNWATFISWGRSHDTVESSTATNGPCFANYFCKYFKKSIFCFPKPFVCCFHHYLQLLLIFCRCGLLLCYHCALQWGSIEYKNSIQKSVLFSYTVWTH